MHNNKKNKRPNPSIQSSFVFVILILLLVPISLTLAQGTSSNTNKNFVTDPNSSDFKLLICDGPENLPESAMKAWESKTNKTRSQYVPCNFNGAMLQIKHLINIMMVIGILAALIGFAWSGYLFMTGVPDKRNQAKDIFKKVIIGFVIMLCAWFMVYQLIKWITPGSSGATYLLESTK